ncbi:MAG TPA: NAD(P)H-binding protein [Pseudonocardiaceae bacterium]
MIEKNSDHQPREVAIIMGRVGTILVTGATGSVGGQAVSQLAGTGVTVRALTRNPRSARSLAGAGRHVEVVGGDLAEPDTLAPVLDGVDAVFLVFPSVSADDAAPALIAALTARARRIVYLSAAGVSDDPVSDDPETPARPDAPDGSILGSHALLERLIRGSAAEWTFLRSSGFASNTLMWAGQLQNGDVLRWYHGGATRALIHEYDLAAVGVRALLDDGHDRARHHLTGPKQLTQVEQLHAIGDAIGRPLRFEELDPRTARTELFADLPGDLIDSIIEAHGAMVNHPEPVTTTVAQLTGRPARPFARWARDHADDFRAADGRPG